MTPTRWRPAVSLLATFTVVAVMVLLAMGAQ